MMGLVMCRTPLNGLLGRFGIQKIWKKCRKLVGLILQSNETLLETVIVSHSWDSSEWSLVVACSCCGGYHKRTERVSTPLGHGRELRAG